MHIYAYPPFIAKCHIYFIYFSKKKKSLRQKKMTKEFTSQPTYFGCDCFGCDATSLDLARANSPGLEPETSAGFAVGYPVGYPLRHLRSGPSKKKGMW